MRKSTNPLFFCFLLLMLFAPSLTGRAQSCEVFPADCPEDLATTQDSETCTRNMIVPEEIRMQNMLRNHFSGLAAEMAKSAGWEVYEFAEFASGIGLHLQDGSVVPLAYALRPPHQFDISFVFIVNKDSLKAWQEWYSVELKDRVDKIVDAYRQQATDLAFRQSRQNDMDSANYYGDLKAKYMNDHFEEYQKALVANDQKGIKHYESEMKKIDDRINYWINKANAKTDNELAGPGKAYNELDAYKRTHTIAYRNSTMIRVKFSINENLAPMPDAGSVHVVRQLSVPGISLGMLLHNSEPDEHAIFDLNQFNRNPDYAFLLFGKWNPKNDQSRMFPAAFTADKKNTDKVTPKKIPCDKVQTIAVYIEASPHYIDTFLHLLNAHALSKLIMEE